MYKTTVDINGMMCSMCEAHINDTIRSAFKVRKVSSSHVKNRAVIISDEPIDTEILRKVINKTGYRFISADSEPYEKRRFRF